MTEKRALRGRLGLGMVAVLATVTLSADARTSAKADRFERFTPIAQRRHSPVKIHQRQSDTSWDSYNWSGYAVTGAAGSVTDAKASWTVPLVSCPIGSKPRQNQNQYSSFWVGIDGFNDNTVEQIGTDSDCQSGTPTYYAWFEFYPNPMFMINSVTIHPGDVISAEVSSTGGGSFTVSLTNVTTNQSSGSISTQVPGAQQSSAEWIAEAPSGAGGVLPLANFGTVLFSQNGATVGGTAGAIGSFGSNVQDITMVGEHRPHPIKAQPSPLSGDGTGFSVTWYSTGP